jgi:hypothetical protein
MSFSRREMIKVRNCIQGFEYDSSGRAPAWFKPQSNLKKEIWMCIRKRKSITEEINEVFCAW